MSSSRAPKPGAWEPVARLAGMIPGVRIVTEGVARSVVQRLLGFWVLWHLYGGLDGMVAAKVGTVPSTYRQRAEFLEVFGIDVEEFALDLAAAFPKPDAGEQTLL